MKAGSQSRRHFGLVSTRSILATLFVLVASLQSMVIWAEDLNNAVSESEGVILAPPEVHFAGLPMDKEATGTIFVDVPADSMWELRNLRCESDRMQMKQRAATDAEKESRGESESLRAIDFTWTPERKFNEKIDTKIKFDVAFVENGKEQVLPREVLVAVGTASRMTISGEIINQNQILMDVVKSSRGKKMFFAVKVRDEEKRLAIKSFKSTVKCLKLHLEPSKDWEKNGLYRLIFEIPKNSEPEWHMSSTDYGVVDIVFDHPRIKPAQFLVQVAVVDED